MRRSLLALSIALALSATAHAQENGATPKPAVNDPSIPLTYVGANARVSLGVNEDGDINGEALGIFGFDGDSAWIGQLWLAEHGAGGVQFDYHWLLGGKTRQDTIDNPDSVRVAKAFVAVDQNIWNDRKATLGVGYQKNDFFVDGYLSGAISGSRFVGSDTDVSTATLSGVENGHSYTQLQTTTVVTDAFEHPYEHGIGVRLGQYFDNSLWRLRGGLDYERGKYNSDQLTLSLGVDKYFRNTGWSLSLDGEQLKKSGDFELDKNDTRGWLSLRYEFGQSYRPREPYRLVEVVAPAPAPAAAAASAAPTLVRNEVKLDGDAFFNFDQDDLRADARAALDELLARLNGNSRVSRILITGHTDSVGSVAYNQGLSERRAASAKAYLLSRGVPAEQIDTRGEGELNPSFPNDTPANRQKNRRVDIEFLTVEESTTPAPAPAPAAESKVEWKREPVAAPAAWIERALRNPAQHKRTVDVYRFERSSTATALGPRQFANTAPNANDDSITVARDAAATPIAVLANDTDPENDALSVTGITPPAHGTASFSSAGVTYTPAAGYVGTDTFTYSISDGYGGSDTATVTVTIGDAGNRPPVAVNDSARTAAATPVTVNVLGNDSDPDGDSLSIGAVGTPAHGTVVRNSNGSVTYTPVAGFEGVDSFSYTVSDGRGGSATATVSVTVGDGGGGNRPPLARDDAFGVIKGGGADFPVLANDSDPDGDTLRVIAVENLGPHQATLTINPDGSIRFQHVHGTNGLGYIRYTITDDHGHEVTATVAVTVTEIL
ncbi:outer membrane protein OmpA-like peptidoglycan-associated protein [Tahibacter aquaticus]|uniref:Outer membrane protein OmpA-like peptidoglycan-associated protein n=1 Tax=Tahibacter aquaticus TaxID=520092 RepID=A0A4V3DNL7_9GAMM|nr:Ig-like domain-containing protein [Tahibacter aquaticus]TDR48896.1 outer membrane protein OmpA-like peptidoglycan-associated protein [Tahibacter aquaticus]